MVLWHKKSERGFTLLELMIVVAIIGILAAIAIPNLIRARLNSNEKAMLGDIKAIRGALEMYRAAEGSYPDLLNDLIEANPPYLDNKWASANTYLGQSGATAIHGYLIGPATGRGSGAAFYDTEGAANNTYGLRFVPEVVGSTANKNYCLDTGGTIYEGSGEVPILVQSGDVWSCFGGVPIA